MPVVRAIPIPRHRLLSGLVSLAVLVLAIDHAVALPLARELSPVEAPLVEVSGHLVISEVMTGGVSASDEFIELYNPSSAVLPLEGLEVVYVTASGATVTRKAVWSAGATGVPPGAHVLIANAGGVFAGLADVAYTNGLAATGGSVALRIVGAASAIDAVGWGNASSSWLETQPAAAPAAGSSLERLPGGPAGSGQDTDDNLVDFFIQPLPDPQNSGSPPIPGPSASPVPTVSPFPSPTPDPSGGPGLTATPAATGSPQPTASPVPTPAASATATPSPAAQSIADARSLPDGSSVTVEGVTLTASDFTDGGGYLVDASAGVAVLVSDGAFGRGEILRVTGTIDDRYAQRTIRTTAAAITSLGSGSEPSASAATTGSIGESLEGRLVQVTGVISSSATTLSAGLAWDLDDGSGPSRVLVGSATGIDTSSWERGVSFTLVGVVGQRDSTGSGTSGFRIQPRDATDILSVEPIPTPSPTATPEPSGTPPASGSESPSPSPASLASISDARAATTGTHLRIRGVVTAPSGLIGVGSAVVQDATAGLLIRIGTDVGSLALGQLVELEGTRSTKAGMLSLRVATPPLLLGSQPDPDPLRRATGDLGEREEARVVIVRGAISSAISRPRGGNVSFAIDDGSGPIRVTVSSRSGVASGSLVRGAWLEVRAVLAQETTGSAPASGYRLWPRIPADLRVVAEPVVGRATVICCAGSHTVERSAAGGGGATALQRPAAAAPFGPAPILSRPEPTSSPAEQSTNSDEPALPGGSGAAAGGAVVSGMGLAALAGLAAWFSRRRRPDDDPPMGAEAFDDGEAGGLQAAPRLSVLRMEATDAQKERRILPPT